MKASARVVMRDLAKRVAQDRREAMKLRAKIDPTTGDPSDGQAYAYNTGVAESASYFLRLLRDAVKRLER